MANMNSAKRRRDIRLLLGFVLAPAVVPLASVLCGWGFVRHYGGIGTDVDSLAPFLRFSFRIELPAVYFLTLLCAVPYVLSLRDRGVLNFWMLLTPLTVVACSLVILVCIAAPSFKYHAACAAVGITAAGLCFYLLGLWRLPGRTQWGYHHETTRSAANAGWEAKNE